MHEYLQTSITNIYILYLKEEGKQSIRSEKIKIVGEDASIISLRNKHTQERISCDAKDNTKI